MGHLRIACSITPLRQPSRTLCDIGNLFLVGIKVVPENWDSKHWDSPFVVGVRMPQYPRLQSGFPMEKSRTGWTTSWSAYAQLTLRTPPLLCQMEIGMIECYIFGGLKSSTLINLLSQAFFSLNFPIAEASRERIERKEALGKGLIVMKGLPHVKKNKI